MIEKVRLLAHPNIVKRVSPLAKKSAAQARSQSLYTWKSRKQVKKISVHVQQTRETHILDDTCDQMRKEKAALTTYRIVSFDGGGTLGALSLQLMNRLAQQTPELISRTDVFSGNSIGSFTALALASGRSPKGTLQYFEDEILPAFSVSRPGGPVFNQQFLQIVAGGNGYYESMVSSHLLGNRFFRLDPRIPNFSKTDPTVFPALIDIANKTNLQPALRFIEKNWK